MRPGRPRNFFLILMVLYSAFLWAEAQQFVTPKLLSHVQTHYSENAVLRLKAWQRLINNNQNKSDLEKLKIVNSFFNQFTYVSDQVLMGQADYWMTPIEFLSYGGGDCEDFAIAKYITLKALNIPDEKLHIVYVKALKLNSAHMVLAYYEEPTSDPFILDILTHQILLASNRPDLLPVYSFNASGLWLAKQRSMGERISGADRLSRWQGVLRKMQQEEEQNR